MLKLISKIRKLRKSKVREAVNKRIKEFSSLSSKSKEKIFSELCFCILTANFNAERSMKMQKMLENEFHYATKKELVEKLKEAGHRFPNMRACYIYDARKHKSKLKQIIKSANDEKHLRNWLVENVKGLGMKEASHFLRNIGFKNVAIVDFHIVDLLVGNKLIKRPKTITKKKYLEIEKVLEKIAKKAKMSLAELDLYLWYMETGKVLK